MEKGEIEMIKLEAKLFRYNWIASQVEGERNRRCETSPTFREELCSCCDA
jgi:hypothetical protein